MGMDGSTQFILSTIRLLIMFELLIMLTTELTTMLRLGGMALLESLEQLLILGSLLIPLARSLH